MSKTTVNGVRFLANTAHPGLSMYTQSRVVDWVCEWMASVEGIAEHLSGVRVWTDRGGLMVHDAGVLATLYGCSGHCVAFFLMEKYDKKTMREGLSCGLARIVENPSGRAVA